LLVAAAGGAAVAVVFRLNYLAYDGLGIDTLAAVIVGESSADSLLCKNGAVYLCGGQTVKCGYDCLIGQLESLFNGFTLDEFSRHRTGGNSGTAAKGLELNINKYAVFYLEVHLHDVAADSVADFADTVCVSYLTDIAGSGKMVKDLIRIYHILHFLFWIYQLFSSAMIFSQTGDMARSLSIIGIRVSMM